MADWAGGYGAGGAAQALEQIVARQFLERKQAEIERAQRAEEAMRQQQLAQQADAQRQGVALNYAQLAANQDEGYQNRQLRTVDLNQRLQRETKQEEVDAARHAGDLQARLDELKQRQTFEAEQNKLNRGFQAYLAGQRGGSDSEPLVSITDPATGQPKLVPRSQAIGQRPASTREQALTEGQSNAAGFADRMKFNEKYIQRFDAQSTSRANQARAFFLPKEMQSDELQGYETAKKNWIAAILRKESGAAISPNEYAEGNLQYFPQPGESAVVVEQKRQLRAVSEAAMRRASGSAGVDAQVQTSQAPKTRTLRNAAGQTRQQISRDGGQTWEWAN